MGKKMKFGQDRIGGYDDVLRQSLRGGHSPAPGAPPAAPGKPWAAAPTGRGQANLCLMMPRLRAWGVTPRSFAASTMLPVRSLNDVRTETEFQIRERASEPAPGRGAAPGRADAGPCGGQPEMTRRSEAVGIMALPARRDSGGRPGVGSLVGSDTDTKLSPIARPDIPEHAKQSMGGVHAQAQPMHHDHSGRCTSM